MHPVLLLRKLLSKLPPQERKAALTRMIHNVRRKEAKVAPEPERTKAPDVMSSYEQAERHDHEQRMEELKAKHELEKLKMKEEFKAFPVVSVITGVLMALAIIGATIAGSIYAYQGNLSAEVDRLNKRVEYLEQQNNTLKRTIGEMVVEEHNRREPPTSQ